MENPRGLDFFESRDFYLQESGFFLDSRDFKPFGSGFLGLGIFVPWIRDFDPQDSGFLFPEFSQNPRNSGLFKLRERDSFLWDGISRQKANSDLKCETNVLC